jgi:hypothetical protein
MYLRFDSGSERISIKGYQSKAFFDKRNYDLLPFCFGSLHSYILPSHTSARHDKAKINAPATLFLVAIMTFYSAFSQMFQLLLQARSLAQEPDPDHWWAPGSRGTESSWNEDCTKNASGCRPDREPSDTLPSSWMVGAPHNGRAAAVVHI